MNKKYILLSTILLSGFTNNFYGTVITDCIKCIKEERISLEESRKIVEEGRGVIMISAAFLVPPTALSQTSFFQPPLIKWPITLFLGAGIADGFKSEGAAALGGIALLTAPLVSLHAGHKNIGNTNIKVWQAATAFQAACFGHNLYHLS